MQTSPLLDANLFWRSAVALKNHFDGCIHVDDTGLPSTPDKPETANCGVP